MNYYKRHVGDYAKKAGHLSILEHGVYTLLLDAYYDRELAPTRAEAIRISRCRTADELAALDAVLADFFVLTNGRYVQSRVEREFVLAEEVAQRNRDNGKTGGRPRKPKGAATKTQTEPTGNPLGSERVTTGNPDLTQKNPNPLIHQSTNPEKAKAGASASGSRLPAGWALPADWREWARGERADVDPDAEAAKFADYWHSLAGAKARKTDWLKTWRNWIRNAHGPRAGPAVQNTTSKTLGAIQTLEGMKRGLAENGTANRISKTTLLELGSDASDGHDSGDGGRLV